MMDIDAKPGSVWRHKKRGSLYIVESLRTFQCSDEELDGATVVEYRAEDGQGWSRPLDEFCDGRFEYIGCFPWLFDDTLRKRGPFNFG